MIINQKKRMVKRHEELQRSLGREWSEIEKGERWEVHVNSMNTSQLHRFQEKDVKERECE